MIPSSSYIKIQNILRQRFLTVEYEGHSIDLHTFLKDFSYIRFEEAKLRRNRDKKMLVGLLFAHPNNRLMSDYMFPNYDYLNVRSASDVDFFWAGYDSIWEDPNLSSSDQQYGFSYRRKRNYRIEFDDESFDSFRTQVERMSSWKYSGGVDLILCTVSFVDHWDLDVHFNFSEAVVLELDKIFEGRSIDYIPRFIERLLRSSEQESGDPLWSYSDKEAVKKGIGAIKNWLLSFLPKDIGKEVEDLPQFAIRDLRR